MAQSELVKRARSLERLLARRRKVVVALRKLDDSIREERKFVRDLSVADGLPWIYPPRVVSDVPSIPELYRTSPGVLPGDAPVVTDLCGNVVAPVDPDYRECGGQG